MAFATPFFQCFKSLLFGKPPVSSLKKAMAALPKIASLAELRHLFGSYFPAALLAQNHCGLNSRWRIFSLEVTFWAFLDQVLTPQGHCREAVRKIMAWHRFENPRGPIGDMSADTSAYCQARLRLPVQTIKDINAHLIARLQANTPTDALWHGRRVKLVDGTGISMPDTAANQALYLRRWEIELHFREIKVLLNMDILRCKTPEMIERELLMHLVAYNLVRTLMQASAASHGADLGRLSFKGTLDTVRHFASAAHAAKGKPRTIEALIQEMLMAVAKDPNPHRPGRSEPRVIKRRRKNYRLLTKPRREMGRLPHRKLGRETNPKTSLT